MLKAKAILQKIKVSKVRARNWHLELKNNEYTKTGKLDELTVDVRCQVFYLARCQQEMPFNITLPTRNSRSQYNEHALDVWPMTPMTVVKTIIKAWGRTAALLRLFKKVNKTTTEMEITSSVVFEPNWTMWQPGTVKSSSSSRNNMQVIQNFSGFREYVHLYMHTEKDSPLCNAKSSSIIVMFLTTVIWVRKFYCKQAKILTVLCTVKWIVTLAPVNVNKI